MISEDELTGVELEFLRGLAGVLQQEGLSEITVTHEGWTTTLKSAAVVDATVATHGVLVPAGVAKPVERRAAAPAKSPEKANLTPVEAPMVGVFYRAPSPGDPNFVEIGDHVEAGQVVGLMEAMKVFNDITSEIEGTVVEILATNGQLVETGNPLLLIRVGL